MEIILNFISEHLLAIAAIILTIIFSYHYLIEKETGARLSRKYRNSLYEAQSKIFLNATQYLILGEKDLAIREFLSAVELSKDMVETYFTLGSLLRSNGEIEKAIGIHRTLIAREGINEGHRLRALKELAIDYDKGGFIDKAIETYKDVLKINRDQAEVIHSLCRIYEDIEDWDQAYNYRVMLSKVAHEEQSETISHILVQKAKSDFNQYKLKKCEENLENAFKYAPSVSAKILRIKLNLMHSKIELAQFHLLELLKESPSFAAFIFMSLSEDLKNFKEEEISNFNINYKKIKRYFLDLSDLDLTSTPSVTLAKIRLLREENLIEEAYLMLKNWMEKNKGHSEVMNAEFIKLLIDLEKDKEALVYTKVMLQHLHQSLAKHYCKQCGFNSDSIFWRCPQCHEWETIQFRWKV